MGFFSLPSFCVGGNYLQVFWIRRESVLNKSFGVPLNFVD